MNKHAIVIESSNVAGQNDLPGARVDAANWDVYLRSALGGSWGDSEITILRKPSSIQVENLLVQHRDKYCFVAFSGHGSYDLSAKTTVVCLNDYEHTCPVEKLKPKGVRGTMIIDACRGHDGQRRYMVEKRASYIALANNERALMSRAIVAHSAPTNFTARAVMSLKFTAAITGIVSMYSCAIGGAAGEYDTGDPLEGGYYSSTLVAVARFWEGRAASGSEYSTKRAHDDTVAYFKEKAIQQVPEYSPTYIAYPFAVKV